MEIVPLFSCIPRHEKSLEYLFLNYTERNKKKKKIKTNTFHKCRRA